MKRYTKQASRRRAHIVTLSDDPRCPLKIDKLSQVIAPLTHHCAHLIDFQTVDGRTLFQGRQDRAIKGVRRV